jgi:hypothetical protein
MLNGLLTPHSKKLVKSETLADQQNQSKNQLLIYVANLYTPRHVHHAGILI